MECQCVSSKSLIKQRGNIGLFEGNFVKKPAEERLKPWNGYSLFSLLPKLFSFFSWNCYYHLVFKVSGVDILRTVYRKYCSCDEQATIQRLDNVVVRSQRRSTYSNVVLTLIPQRQNYNVAPAMPRRWIKSSTQNTLWVLYWQRYYKVEIATSNSKRFFDVDLMPSNLQP